MNDISGHSPLHSYSISEDSEKKVDFDTLTILCETDETIVTQISGNSVCNGMLPLHLFLINNAFSLHVSVEADCFRYLLHLYPAAAAIRDAKETSLYDWAVRPHIIGLYYIRLLLKADLTIEPERRRDLNFSARKEAMFLVFRALSSTDEPSIWVKLHHEDRDLLFYAISYL
jgi:hypothetical protein